MVYFDNHESDTLLGLKIPKNKLSEDEKRNLYLNEFYKEEMYGPLTGYPTKDRPWLKSYTDDEIIRELPQVSAYSYLYRNNIASLNNIAINYDNEKITYEKLFNKIDEAAKALKQSGVKENDVITLSIPNNIEFICLFYAISKIGCTAHIIDSNMDIKDIEKYIKAVGSTMTFIMDKNYESFKPLIDNNTINKSVVITPKVKKISDLFKNYKVDYNDRTINWKDFIDNGKKYEDETSRVEYIENRPLLIVHTSGTSGDKKTVVLTNENINAVALQCADSGINIEKKDKWLTTLPNYRPAGITMGIHLPLVNSLETILVPDCDEAKFEQIILKNKPNHMIGTYKCYKKLLNSYKFSNKDFSFLKTPIAISDVYTNLEESINEFFKKHNCDTRILKGYGMTELGGPIAGTPHNNNAFGSVGIPFTKTIVGIFDPKTGKELQYNQDGEICISGPTVMDRYLDDKELTNKVIKKHEDGRLWLHTGDRGYINEDGNLYVSYRLEDWENQKDTGKKLEEKIRNYWTVDDCKVITNRDVKHRETYEANIRFIDRVISGELESVAIRPIQALCEREFPNQFNLITYKFVDSIEKEEKKKVKTL